MYLRERKAQQTRNQRFNMWASVARVWRKQREVFESAIDFICALWEKRRKKNTLIYCIKGKLLWISHILFKAGVSLACIQVTWS